MVGVMVRTKEEIEARIKMFKSAMKCSPDPFGPGSFIDGVITGLEWSLGDDYEPPPEP